MVMQGEAWPVSVWFGSDLWCKVLMVGANPTATIEAKAFAVRLGVVWSVLVWHVVIWSGKARSGLVLFGKVR